MAEVGIKNHAAFIWSVADLLRGDYKQSKYGKVILPLTVIRRLDCVLEPTKAAVLSLLRAMGAGANVLAFDSTFNREVLLDQGRYLSRANDLVALLEAQEAGDEDTLDSRATAARDRFRQAYNWDVVAAAYLKACRKVMADQPPIPGPS